MWKTLSVIALALSFGPAAFAEENLSFDITTSIQGKGDVKGKDGEWVGARGGTDRIVGITIKKRSGPKNVKIEYRCYFWYHPTKYTSVEEGQKCEGERPDLAISGFRASLKGEGADNYRLSYQCDVQDKGESGMLAPQTCGAAGGPRLRALFLKIWPAPSDRGYIDGKVALRAWRLKTAEPPKVAFTVKLGADLSSFYVAYQRAGAAPGDQPKTTKVTTVDPANKPDHYGDHLGRDEAFNSEALEADTEYDYWVAGQYRNEANKTYTSGKARFKTEPVKGLKEGILTGEASQPSSERTTVTLHGVIGKPKEEGTAYIEYGTNPNKLTGKTAEKGFNAGEDFSYSADVDLLQPETKYFYRLVADYANGQTARGGMMSTTVAKLNFKKESPCEGRMLPAPYQMATRLSEDLAVVCSYHTAAGSIYKGSGAGGKLVCPAQFPRNLNTKILNFKIPKLDIPVTIEERGVGFSRSSEDFRFNDWQLWANKGDEGQQDPVRQGFQPYSAVNWNPSPQKLIVWIYCSSNWSDPDKFK